MARSFFRSLLRKEKEEEEVSQNVYYEEEEENHEREYARKFCQPYCEKRERVVDVLFHEGKHDTGNVITAEDHCVFSGCCYPCFTEGVFHKPNFCGKIPPSGSRIKCTKNLHHYTYFAGVTDNFFLNGKLPHEIPKETWELLENFIPEEEKGYPPFYL